MIDDRHGDERDGSTGTKCASKSELLEVDVLVVDCQTTGATPEQGRMIELGWWHVGGSGAVDSESEVRSELISLDGGDLPGRIEQMTGITETMLDGARPLEGVWAEFCAALDEVGRWVAHYAQFERRFLEAAREQFGAPEHPPPSICTHRLAERLYPGLPRRGLEAVAGFLGHPTDASNRAGPYVRATADIWRAFRSELVAREEVRDGEDLDAFLESPVPDADGGTYAIDRDRRLALPDDPGVYRLLDAASETLYVGKATSLKRRVNQYFQTRDGLSGSKRELASQVHDVEVQQTGTALEAALAEVDVIKREDPPYNEVLGPKEGAVTALDAETSGVDVGVAPVDRIPLRDSSRVRFFLALVDAFEPLDGLSGHLRVEEPEVPEVVAGFRSTHEIPDAPGLERLSRLGLELWPRLDRPADDEPTPRERLASLIRGGARELRLGIWLERLAGGSVAWEHEVGPPGDTCWRRLELDGARRNRVESLDTEPAASEGFAVEMANSGSIQTRADFDRLRVLTTELRRVVSNGSRVVADLPEGARLRSDSLGALLALI